MNSSATVMKRISLLKERCELRCGFWTKGSYWL